MHYPGPTASRCPRYLFVPKNLDRAEKHPAIVWMHGDGVNQNYDGWHVQRNYAVYYSFHQYLLQQGYVVLAPDYRGSIGYGARVARRRVHGCRRQGLRRTPAMAPNYLKTLPYVDTDRIGVWGLSYGGFFTLLALTDQPTLFRAAVNVAGVADYAMYYEDPVPRRLDREPHRDAGAESASLRAGVTGVARRSPRARRCSCCTAPPT